MKEIIQILRIGFNVAFPDEIGEESYNKWFRTRKMVKYPLKMGKMSKTNRCLPSPREYYKIKDTYTLETEIHKIRINSSQFKYCSSKHGRRN